MSLNVLFDPLQTQFATSTAARNLVAHGPLLLSILRLFCIHGVHPSSSCHLLFVHEVARGRIPIASSFTLHLIPHLKPWSSCFSAEQVARSPAILLSPPTSMLGLQVGVGTHWLPEILSDRFLIYFVYMCMGARMCHGASVEVRQQLARVGSLLLPCESRECVRKLAGWATGAFTG